MARGVGVLRPERRAERVDIRQRAGKRLAFKLSADGQVGPLAEEIRLGLLLDVALQRGDSEHLPRPLAIARRDDRRVHIDKIPLLKELMDGIRQPAPHPEHRPIQVRPRPQMGDRPQELLRVPFLLQRVARFRHAHQLNARRAQLPLLTRRRRSHQLAVHRGGGAGGELRHVLRAGRAGIHNHLQVRQAGTVVEFQEREPFRIAPGANPPSRAHGVLRFSRSQYVFD